MLKKKWASVALACMLILILSVGAGTYALFTGSASNTNNLFTAGQLDVTAKRDDVPYLGPMFYTESVEGQVGAMPTGLWAPGDKHTRGLFLENEGTLDAKLKIIQALPTNSSGQIVSSTSTGSNLDAYNDAILFSKQADVLIWEFERIGRPLFGVDANDYDIMMDVLNGAYQIWRQNNPEADLDDQNNVAQLLNAANGALLEYLNTRSNDTNNTILRVDRIYKEKLYKLLTLSFNASSQNIITEPDEAVLLGVTVDFLKRPPAGSHIDPNSMQGKSVYFTFSTYWEQVRNN